MFSIEKRRIKLLICITKLLIFCSGIQSSAYVYVFNYNMKLQQKYYKITKRYLRNRNPKIKYA